MSHRALGLVVALMLTRSARADIVFSDGTFDDANWVATAFGTGSFSFTAAQQPSGGNPGPFRDVDHTFSGGGATMQVFHIYNGAAYNPAVQGTIDSLDFMIDFKNINIFGAGQGYGAAVFQNGQYYRGGDATTGLAGIGVWTADSFLDLQASSFVEVLADGSIDSGSHPDFSAVAGPILFGFVTRNSTGSTGSIEVGYDNWSISVTSVPEPSSIMMLAAAGLAVASFAVACDCRQVIGEHYRLKYVDRMIH